jgi:hypothetical protein
MVERAVGGLGEGRLAVIDRSRGDIVALRPFTPVSRRQKFFPKLLRGAKTVFTWPPGIVEFASTKYSRSWRASFAD